MISKDFLERTDKGVSPVIGVILMVAITVVLAAVIGAFALNTQDTLGGENPSAALNYESSSSQITVVKAQNIDSITISYKVDVDGEVNGTPVESNGFPQTVELTGNLVGQSVDLEQRSRDEYINGFPTSATIQSLNVTVTVVDTITVTATIDDKQEVIQTFEA